MPKEKYVAVIGNMKGIVFPLKDTDLWGFYNVFQHAIDSGYAKDNLEWHKYWQTNLDKIRHSYKRGYKKEV